MNEDEIIQHFVDTQALLTGHFVLRSGLHSERFFQAALLLQHTRVAALLCGELAERFRDAHIETVISPAIGGIVVGQEVGRHLGVRAIFAEKDDAGGLVLRRGFTLRAGERVLIAEDVVTRGGRVQQTIDLVRQHGAAVAGVAVMVDRSGGSVDFGVPTECLAKLQLATYDPQECPLCRAKVPVEKPGSK